MKAITSLPHTHPNRRTLELHLAEDETLIRRIGLCAGTRAQGYGLCALIHCEVLKHNWLGTKYHSARRNLIGCP